MFIAAPASRGRDYKNSGLLFSQFSTAAQAVVHLAEQECRNASHYYLGTEHVLLAMAIAPPAGVLDYFQALGAQPWEIKRALRAAMDPPCEHPWEGIIITPRVRRLFDGLASEHAGKAPVEPIDLLNAIVADGGGVAARVLAAWSPSPTARR
jgi:ATP-dependent Clp protease ATP-binding subunit ClpA